MSAENLAGEGKPEYKQGFRWEGEDAELLRSALDAAFEYRGNVTLLLKQGGDLTGYLYNRDWNAQEPFVSLIPEDGSASQKVPFGAIGGIVFSGRDTAEGTSWQTWLKKSQTQKKGI